MAAAAEPEGSQPPQVRDLPGAARVWGSGGGASAVQCATHARYELHRWWMQGEAAAPLLQAPGAAAEHDEARDEGAVPMSKSQLKKQLRTQR